jgi:hypothetical protein
MSNFTKPRVTRKNIPPFVITKSNYRSAISHLLLDFGDRCAYSMQHSYRAGGVKCMEVDHFNPRKKKRDIQEYSNLFLSTRHCNGAKRDRWPKGKDRDRGIRFLDCCREVDYGKHIFEDPDTHEVVGVTPAGIYHVRNCDLNAPHLVQERKERAELRRLLDKTPIVLSDKPFILAQKPLWSLPDEATALSEVLKTMIPEIPYLEGDALEKHRARKKAIAALTGT